MPRMLLLTPLFLFVACTGNGLTDTYSTDDALLSDDGSDAASADGGCRGGGRPGGRGPHRGPPAEALAACAGLTADAACSFTHGDRTLTGTCALGPDGATLACRPPPPAPPAEAITACAGLAADAACSVTLGGNTLPGTCALAPDGATLACRPSGPPPGGPHGPGGHRGPPPEALAACASSAAGASCTVTLPDGRALTGTCVAGPDGAPLACLPPRP